MSEAIKSIVKPQPAQHHQKKVGATRVTRAFAKLVLHQHYHSEAHKFYNAKQLRKSRAGGQAATKTKNGAGWIVPPCIFSGMPQKLIHDPSKPPYNPIQLRAMRHGIYRGEY